jgi:hypothetical protein
MRAAQARALRHWTAAQATAQAVGLRPPSAAHVSQILARRYPRASRSEYEGVSGFYVSGPVRTDAGRLVVTVGYHSWDRPDDYSDRWRAHMAQVTRAAFARYARHLRRNGYDAEPWMRYDGAQPGLFVTRRTSRTTS